MTGKEKCEYLKKLREATANYYNIRGFEYKPCEHWYGCNGTCEACDKEAQQLFKALKEKNADLQVLTNICTYKTDNTNDTNNYYFDDEADDATKEAKWENKTKLEQAQRKEIKKMLFRFNNHPVMGLIREEDFYAIEQRQLKSIKKRPKLIRKLFNVGQVLGISRIRVNIDGPGITTLVGLYKCPLNCAYCINSPNVNWVEYTIRELYNEIKLDSLYFDTTGGGICFGGHEPLLQQKFIKNFIKFVRKQGHTWKIGLETSLNGELDSNLIEMLDFIIVDIKSISPEIYTRYTGGDNKIVLENLKLIKDKIPNITIRIPLIENYNNPPDIEKSINYLEKLGYRREQLDIFFYKTDVEKDWR